MSNRRSASRPDAGVVEFESRGFNQKNELVARVRRKALMKARSTQIEGAR